MGKVLITGGAGFIGVNLAAKLLDRGSSVIVLDNLSREGSRVNLGWLLKHKNSKKLKIMRGDIRNQAHVKQAVPGCEIVFHLAAQVAVTTSVTNPKEDFEINALGTFNVLEEVHKSSKRPIFIYSSTNKVYGEMTDIGTREGKTRYMIPKMPFGVNERNPLDFHSPYGCSKGAADQYVHDYFRIYNLPTVVFRQSCIYGPRQMGVEDQGWVAYFAICNILGKPITLYGDGKQVRDVLYVDDLIDAYFLAVKNIKKCAGRVYNIGGGVKNAVSLLEYIELLEKIVGRNLKIHRGNWRPGDQKVYISDIRLLEKEIGWKPKVNLESGVEKLVTWIQENRKIFD
ncbi:CDP-paratose 2-epimerase [Candidatus Curtissbacteria bacterium RIFCSPHIGHO2_02_FULL_40_17]|uniref:CDP-paratose 2-epimerase n=4 Tax=Candidatus Curtissiibacteriota TaxID=1752717 RepID=A0A1F5GID4_9BACT|nr:MAG: CDP-paratose 2-epimerase [Candidatus Curtissbacteria bacterium RIFCSPHIGHO2_01_FULL_40_12]OGD91585.1 MAG: CDP-paratose 2-epimerase [Candidatus Curtissbacteria bacterium RIFCSPHIGHO2_02_FULL_40_17]OGE03448.1 MAG: CDP-paratose 2-epimerase [Candidatus Curtissbacteria bacterium RIFCSPHIGHO2_12_FULL_41_17]OGE07889.1 MAG: CDP-paratose 2-epimerase [Candidatus Curtissbacteria bacterium RIFCSPLOWO2_02_FULL_40_13b]